MVKYLTWFVRADIDSFLYLTCRTTSRISEFYQYTGFALAPQFVFTGLSCVRMSNKLIAFSENWSQIPLGCPFNLLLSSLGGWQLVLIDTLYVWNKHACSDSSLQFLILQPFTGESQWRFGFAVLWYDHRLLTPAYPGKLENCDYASVFNYSSILTHIYVWSQCVDRTLLRYGCRSSCHVCADSAAV